MHRLRFLAGIGGMLLGLVAIPRSVARGRDRCEPLPLLAMLQALDGLSDAAEVDVLAAIDDLRRHRPSVPCEGDEMEWLLEHLTERSPFYAARAGGAAER